MYDRVLTLVFKDMMVMSYTIELFGNIFRTIYSLPRAVCVKILGKNEGVYIEGGMKNWLQPIGLYFALFRKRYDILQ